MTAPGDSRTLDWLRTKLAEAETDRDENERHGNRGWHTADQVRASERRTRYDSRCLQNTVHELIELAEAESGTPTSDPYTLGRRAFATEVEAAFRTSPLGNRRLPDAETFATAEDLSELHVRSVVLDHAGIPWTKRQSTDTGGLWDTTEWDMGRTPLGARRQQHGWVTGDDLIDVAEGREFTLVYGAPKPATAPETVESVVGAAVAEALRKLHELDKRLPARVLFAQMMRDLDDLERTAVPRRRA